MEIEMEAVYVHIRFFFTVIISNIMVVEALYEYIYIYMLGHLKQLSTSTLVMC